MCLVSTSTRTRRGRPKFPGGRRPAGRRPSYHHGDLREALIRAAVQLIEDQGPDGFTLREAARVVGVTHTAPYRHFADRDALLVAVAQEGFQGLGAAMQARQAGLADPRARLQAIGIAYVEYAVAHPSHFRLMHAPVADTCLEAAYVEAKSQPFQILLDAISACQTTGQIPPGPPLRWALAAWSTVHGLADLLMSGSAFRMGVADGTPTDVARQVTADVLDGLAMARQPASRRPRQGTTTTT
ncbi:MAG: TetR/AcrR family transcriptional regulator [Vicinamibacterales bacterium]